MLNRHRCEHRHRREWPVCASSLLRGCGMAMAMADPRAHTAHASRSCYRSGCRVCHAGAAAAARERPVQPDAMQWLWVLMRAGRVSPAPTRTAAESTRCSIATAVSTDIDAKMACVCIEPVRPRNGRPTGTHSTRQSVLPPKRLRRVCVMRVLRQQQLLLHPTECGPSASCSCELVDASW